MRQLKLATQYRNAEFEITPLARAEGAPDDAPARYRMSVSSEFAVKRWFGLEVLSHEKSAIVLKRAKRGLSVRDRHSGDVIAIAENPEVGDDRRLYFEIVFSRNPRAQEIERDVNAKPRIRRFLSVAYDPLEARLMATGTNGKPDEYLITLWEPIHIAFEPDPADYTVGPGRAEDEHLAHPVTIVNAAVDEEEERTMPPDNPKTSPDPQAAAGAAVATRDAAGAPAPIAVGVDYAQLREQHAEISALAVAHGMADRIPDWTKRGLNVDQVSREILEAKRTQGPGQPASEAIVPLSPKDRSRYSYCRAILAVDGAKLDGLERAVHQEIERKQPQNYVGKGGVFVPLRLSDEPRGERALASGAAGAGAELVYDRPGELIELLRNRTVVAQMGARVLAGLTAPVPFAKQTGAAVAYWTGENPGVDVASSQFATGTVLLSPKPLQADSSFSRTLLTIAAYDIEQMVREDIGAGHGLAIDRAAIHGKGSAAEPAGLYYIPDVQPQAMGGVPTYAKAVEMTGMVADKNALRQALGWITTPLMAAKLMTVLRFSGTSDRTIWEGDVLEGTMAGYRALSTNQVSKVMSGSVPTGGSEHGMIFGNWGDLVIGLWGAMELIPDPYAKKKQGMIEITSYQMADCIARHGESFAKSTGATIA